MQSHTSVARPVRARILYVLLARGYSQGNQYELQIQTTRKRPKNVQHKNNMIVCI